MALDFFTKETACHKIYVDFVVRLSNGEYRTVERLPSCMTVAGKYNVSKSTAHNAYRRLESDGYIIFTRTGTFVADISGLSPHTSLAELLIDTIEHARQNGISDEDITGALEILMERYC